MEGFQYMHGDRPLEGYTIQRAVGRGGFGEVYYAISDAGREVALKAVNGYEQIEVRGVSQCMNLKSPHLVSIFDIKQSDQGKSFVIMEYVSGPSLKDLLDQSPAGLGVAKTAFFLREIAKGLSFLHERGIVHRDLKPANIFYEDGYVKIGDYGLSKAIGVSRHSGQTITVGTVHYMAPEVGMGKYDRSIDIYAMGVVLYEMLTGQVPFFGSSHGEILMKHLMSQPDLTGIEEPFATAIRRAMSKDPAERYQSVQELVEAVFGEEHVRNSVSCFSPDSLTMVAGRVARKVAVGAGGSSGPPQRGYGTYQPPATDAPSDVWADVANRVEKWTEDVGQRMGRWGERVGERVARPWSGDAADSTSADAALEQGEPANDPLERRQRRWLAVIAVLVVGAGTGLVTAHQSDGWGFCAIPFTLMGYAGLMFARQRFAPRLPPDSGVLHRLAFGGTAAAFMCTMLPLMMGLSSRYEDRAAGTLAAVGLGLLLLDWRERTAIAREERVSLGEAFVAGVVGWVICLFTEGSGLMAGGILAGLSLAVQVGVPWDPVAARKLGVNDRSGGWWKRTSGRDDRTDQADAAHPAIAGQAPPRGRFAPAAAGNHTAAAAFVPSPQPLNRLPGWIRAIFMGLFIVLLGTGMLCLAAAGIGRFSDDKLAVLLSLGVGSLLCSMFFLTRALKQTYRSYWSGLVRPFLLLLCMQSAFTSLVVMGTESHLHEEELLVGLAFVIFPLILLIVMAFISDRSVARAFGQIVPDGRFPSPSPAGVSQRDAFVALILACGGFLGIAGLHRFYAGRYVTGLLWLCTIGFLGFGTIFDLVIISMGLFRDGNGLPLRVWMGVERTPPMTRRIAPLPEWPVTQPGAPIAGGIAAARQNAAAPDPAGSARVPAATAQMVHGSGRSRPALAPAMTNLWLSLPAGILLLAALGVGLLLAFDLPGLVAAGFPDKSLSRELTQAFGYSDWPRLVHKIGQFLAIMIGLAGTLFLLIARRRSGAAHVGRALLGAMGLLLTVSMLMQACSNIEWFSIVALFETGQPGRGLDTLLDQLDARIVIAAGVVLVGSIVVLVWPEHRAPLTPVLREGHAP